MIHNSPAYDPEGYFCPVCGYPDDMPHGEPCELSDHDAELIAAEMTERELPDTPDMPTSTQP